MTHAWIWLAAQMVLVTAGMGAFFLAGTSSPQATRTTQAGPKGSDPYQDIKEHIRKKELARIPILLKQQRAPEGQSDWVKDGTLTMSNGVKVDASQMKDRAVAGATEFKALEYHDMEVRVYGGDVAIVTGRLTEQVLIDGKDLSGEKRFTRVWVLEADGVWRLAAHHSTPVAKKNS